MKVLRRLNLLSLFLYTFFIFEILHSASLETIKVGVYNNYPKVYITEEGEVLGIFPEIIETIASKQGWQIEFVKGTWNKGLERLRNAQIDVMVDVALSDVRREKYDFNQESVMVSWGCIYTRSGKDVNTILDLEGKTIAVMKNSILTNGVEGIINLAKRYEVDCNFIEVDDYYQVFTLVQNGEADAAVVNRHFGAAFEDEYNLKKNNFIFNPTQLRLAFPKDSKRSEYFIPRIDKVLKEMQGNTDSQYYEILAKYNLYPKKGIPEWIQPLIGGLIIVVIFFTIVYMILKWRIKQKTKALQNTNEILKKEIAEHQHTMKELKLSRENYRNFVENIPGLVYMYDQDELGHRNPIIQTNRIEEFLGKEIADKVKKDYNSFFNYIVKEDKQKVREVTEETKNTGQVFDREYRVKIDENNLTWFRSIGRVKKLPNGQNRWQGVMLDINQRKEAENQLMLAAKRWQSTFDASNDSIWILDSDQHILQANKASEAIFGIPHEKLLNKYCYNSIHKTEKPIPDCPFIRMERTLKRETKELKLETELWLQITVDPIFDENHNLIGAVHNVRDITERKKIEYELDLSRGQLEELVETRTKDLAIKTKELEKAYLDLKEADKLKSVFLASMSHELRTPLNSIIGFTGILLMGMVGDLTDEQCKQLKIVKESANHLLHLINDVLDISKIEAGKVELTKETVDIKEVIDEVVNSFEHKAIEKKLTIEKKIYGPIKIFTDRRRFKQVIINLMGNAIKFTEKGKVSIECVLTKYNNVRIKVMDTGIGIKKEDMGKLFKPFLQVDSSLTKKHEGTGLGLHLSKKILDLLHGDISVQSTWKEGTTFIVSIPTISKENSNEKSISN